MPFTHFGPETGGGRKAWGLIHAQLRKGVFAGEELKSHRKE